MVRADSGCPGEEGRKQWVRRRTGKRGRGRDSSSASSSSSPSVIISGVIEGRSGVGREGGEVELTSSTSWRSVRAYYHILPVKAFNSHIYAIKGILMHIKQQLAEDRKSHSRNAESVQRKLAENTRTERQGWKNR